MAIIKRNGIDVIDNHVSKYGLKGNVWQVKQTSYHAIVRRNGLVECRHDEGAYKRNTRCTPLMKKDSLPIKCFMIYVTGIITKHSMKTG
jgi:hypothetical protein